MGYSPDLKRIARRNWTTCRFVDKRRYETRSEAYLEFERQRSLAEPKGKLPTDFYYHPACGGWHLTSSGERGGADASEEGGG